MNSSDLPQTHSAFSPASLKRLDCGVLLIATVIIGGWLMSIVGLVAPSVRDFILPRFGWVGLFISVNSLIFIGFWIKKPTRSGLLAASFMTCVIGVINGYALLRIGTVDVVQNVFHDHLHSAWLWSVVSYLCAGGYLAFAAFRNPGVPTGQSAG